MASLPAYNPEVPYLGIIPGGMRHGSMIRINGQMTYGGDRFNIHIQTGPALRPRDNCPLHLSVRPNEGAIIRNYFENQNWGAEERFGNCPIHVGQPFEILILSEHSAYKIAVNGIHHSIFNHRMPLSSCRFIAVDGDCTITSIKLEGDNPIATAPPIAQPIYQPPISHYPIHHGHGQGHVHGPSYPPVGGVPVMPGYMPRPSMNYPTYPGQIYPQPGHDGHATPYNTGYQPIIDNTYNNPQISYVPQTQYYHQGETAEELKKKKRNKALKYAAGIGGVGLGAYALSRAFGGNGSDSD